MSAYETAFYGAKAFVYLMGFASMGRDSQCYLDAFVTTERRVGKSKMAVYETMRVHKFPERLTHAMLWPLVLRLLDTTTFEGELLAAQTALKIVDWEKFSALRNRIAYDGAFWPMADDLPRCDLVADVVIDEIVNAAWLDAEVSSPFASEYFKVARLLRLMLSGIIENIAKLAPAIANEGAVYRSLGREPLAAQA
jgi:hypothetical protein